MKTPNNYTSGQSAIYKNQVYKVVANYTDKKEAKILVGNKQIIAPSNERE